MCNVVLIFSITEPIKRLFEFEKPKNNGFLNKKNFSCIIVIKKWKTMLNTQCFPVYSVKTWLLNLDYSLSDSCLRKTVFTMLYVYTIDITHMDKASS